MLLLVPRPFFQGSEHRLGFRRFLDFTAESSGAPGGGAARQEEGAL